MQLLYRGAAHPDNRTTQDQKIQHMSKSNPQTSVLTGAQTSHRPKQARTVMRRAKVRQ